MNINPLEVHFDSLHKGQNDPWNFRTSGYEQNKYHQQIQLVKSHITPTRILEIGCSIGAHTLLISQSFPNAKITALDISVSAIERAKINTGGYSNIDFIVSEITDFLTDTKDLNYDVVFWSETFDQLHKYYTFDQFIKLIEALRKSMSNGGILCISHITAKNNNYRAIDTPRSVLTSYHTMIKEAFDRILESTYQAHKLENDCVYEYQIFLYSPILNLNRPVNFFIGKIDKVDIVIPARDESATIANIVNEMRRSKYTQNVIVVDNDSADSTYDEAKNAGAIVISCLQRGYGNAVKAGINSSQLEWVVKMDADIENPDHLWLDKVIEEAENNHNFLVKTWWSPTLEDPDRVSNFTVRPAMKIFFPELAYLKSPLSGIYLLNKDKLNCNSLPNNFSFDIALLLDALHHQYTIGQVEIQSVIHASVEKQKRTLQHYFEMSDHILQYIVNEGRIRI